MSNKRKQEIREQHPDSLFLEIAKKRKKQNILTGIVITLIVSSFFGTGIGISNLIKIDTGLAYLGLALIISPLAIIILGLISLALENKLNRKKIVYTVSVNILISAFIGLCIVVLYLLKLGTLLAYITSAIIICIVLYIAINAIKAK